LFPADASKWQAELHFNLDEALSDVKPDAVMMLRVQAERMNASYFPSEREYSRIWGMNAERLALLIPETLIMHPGPMNRGLEITAVAADSKNSTVLEQVANGVSVRMAVLYQLLSGERANIDA
jgi:aspartate carbamoyltransferase catalytic subunit